LFDDTEDDEFDGDLGEDDEELPMIKAKFKVEMTPVSAVKAISSPRRVAKPT
jgi:hypothetical protein